MMMRFVRSARLANASYAHAADVGMGIVVTAGACPVDKSGTVTGGNDVRRQTEVALANLATALEDAGTDFSRVVKTTVYVVVPADETLAHIRLDETWETVRAAFADTRPASTLLGVSRLGYPGQLVEVEALAVTAG